MRLCVVVFVVLVICCCCCYCAAAAVISSCLVVNFCAVNFENIRKQRPNRITYTHTHTTKRAKEQTTERGESGRAQKKLNGCCCYFSCICTSRSIPPLLLICTDTHTHIVVVAVVVVPCIACNCKTVPSLKCPVAAAVAAPILARIASIALISSISAQGKIHILNE